MIKEICDKLDEDYGDSDYEIRNDRTNFEVKSGTRQVKSETCQVK